MVELKGGKLINNLESEIEVHENGKFLGGELRRGSIGRYFHRQNQRYTEVFAGHFGKNYGLAMDGSILQILLEKDTDYIFIETQYAIYEISLQEFINRMVSHAGIDNIYLCSELDFVKHEKKDDLADDNKEKESKEKELDKDNTNKPLTKMADSVEELEEILKERDGYYYKDQIPRQKRNAGNCIEMAIEAYKVNKKAEENGKKAKKEEPIGKRDTGKSKKKDKDYKEGEQIGLF